MTNVNGSEKKNNRIQMAKEGEDQKMNGLTIEVLNHYVKGAASKKQLLITCGEENICLDDKAASNINIIQSFIKLVASEARKSIVNPDYFYSDVVFVCNFLKTFTNFPVPMIRDNDVEEIDIQKTFSMATNLGVIDNIFMIPFVNQLKGYIDKQIGFQDKKTIAYVSQSSASGEAIDNVNLVLNKSIDLLDKAVEQLEKNGNKLFSALTPNNITKLVNTITNSFSGRDER